ncbi:unnamed protein product [Parnassius mnemosyne]|uniref:Transcription factor TFIIIC triple barrel domain-containing protein n=1 Tax=Parnassius mnemosyne TaxID=213953 RepID=A0AAV1LZW3_9NEOP
MNDTTSDSEEEILVYAEFKDSVNIEKYKSIHILGIDGKTPIVQLDDTFFTGKFENPLGTYLFFEEDPSPHCADPLFDKLPERNLKYLHKTTKLLCMEHAYVAPKEGSEESIQSQLQQPHQDDDIKPVTFNTLQKALETFKKDWEENGENNLKPAVTP